MLKYEVSTCQGNARAVSLSQLSKLFKAHASSERVQPDMLPGLNARLISGPMPEAARTG